MFSNSFILSSIRNIHCWVNGRNASLIANDSMEMCYGLRARLAIPQRPRDVQFECRWHHERTPKSNLAWSLVATHRLVHPKVQRSIDFRQFNYDVEVPLRYCQYDRCRWRNFDIATLYEISSERCDELEISSCDESSDGKEVLTVMQVWIGESNRCT